MSSADRSQTERIRRLRGQIQAVRRAECAACPELGPQGPTDQSTWISRKFGQMEYRREAANGAIQTQSCCPSDAGTFTSSVNDNNTIILTFSRAVQYITRVTFTIVNSAIFGTIVFNPDGSVNQGESSLNGVSPQDYNGLTIYPYGSLSTIQTLINAHSPGPGVVENLIIFADGASFTGQIMW